MGARIAIRTALIVVLDLGNRRFLDGPPDDQQQGDERDLHHHGDPEDSPKTSHRGASYPDSRASPRQNPDSDLRAGGAGEPLLFHNGSMSASPDRSFQVDQRGLERALSLLLEELAHPSHGKLDLPASLPAEGIGELDALERLAPAAVGGARRLGAPGFLAHMDPPTPWVTWAGTQWAAALNQNLLHDDSAPVARGLERVVVGWLAPLFGMDGGHLVPGSTVANLTALWAARELRGVREVVASEAAHLSVPKAAALLGLGFRTVPADERQRLRASELGDLSRAALVLTAGTTVSGAVDPLSAAVGEAAWRHVDAAWAGPLRLSERHAGLLDGIETADSVAVSAHKWLFQPKESALVLFADSERAHAELSFGSGYLAQPNVGLLGSHGAAALPLAATLLAWGRTGTAARIDACLEIADRLAAAVEADERLELFSGPETGVVVWRPAGVADLPGLRRRLEGAFVSLATVAGDDWLRSVSANPMADPDLVVEAVLRATPRAPTRSS
jgi:L-2,4-diaminobutyrate decarboxylase